MLRVVSISVAEGCSYGDNEAVASVEGTSGGEGILLEVQMGHRHMEHYLEWSQMKGEGGSDLERPETAIGPKPSVAFTRRPPFPLGSRLAALLASHEGHMGKGEYFGVLMGRDGHYLDRVGT